MSTKSTLSTPSTAAGSKYQSVTDYADSKYFF